MNHTQQSPTSGKTTAPHPIGHRRQLRRHLRLLTREVTVAASRLGHDLRHWRIFGSNASSHCHHCGAGVVCVLRTDENQPQRFGAAVVQVCGENG